MLLVVCFMLFSITQVKALDACPKCGSIEVSYPLSTNDNCGDPRYKIFCNNGVLEFLSAKGISYKVLSIDPSAYKLVISPPNIEINACYSSDVNVEGLWLDENLPFNISNRNTVMLLNCTENIRLSPMNCSSSSICRQYEDKVAEASVCKNTLCCHYLKDSSMASHRIRVRIGGCTAYTSVVNMKSPNLADEWKYGIELQWVPPY